MDDRIYSKIIALTDLGNTHIAEENYDLAIEKFLEALKLVPEPKNKWDASTWILASIGDCYFYMGDDISALNYFLDSYNCPGATTNPFILLRLGELYFEMSEHEKAGEFLTRAYMLEGKKIFDEEEPKYFDFLQEILRDVR